MPDLGGRNGDASCLGTVGTRLQAHPVTGRTYEIGLAEEKKVGS